MLDRRIMAVALVLLLVALMAALATLIGVSNDSRDRVLGNGPAPGFDPSGRSIGTQPATDGSDGPLITTPGLTPTAQPVDTTPFVMPTAAVNPNVPTTTPQRVFETTTTSTSTTAPRRNLPPDPRVDPICLVNAAMARLMDDFLLNDAATQVPVELAPTLRAGATVLAQPGGPDYSAMVALARETADRVEQATSLEEARTAMRQFTQPTDPAVIADFQALYRDTEQRCPVDDGPVRRT